MYSLLTLFASHLVSFFVNYVGKKEYHDMTPQVVMIQPYKRVVMMHITVLFGGIVVSALGSPVVALVILVLMKIALDLFAHKKEHAVDPVSSTL